MLSLSHILPTLGSVVRAKVWAPSAPVNIVSGGALVLEEREDERTVKGFWQRSMVLARLRRSLLPVQGDHRQVGRGRGVLKGVYHLHHVSHYQKRYQLDVILL